MFNRFDTYDIANLVRTGKLGDVILHEMGHIIGIGTLWRRNKLLDAENNYSVETRATNVWRNEWGCVGIPPVEKDGGAGTAFGHWDEQCLSKELMTGRLGPGLAIPFSRLTIASVEDLGYTVNYNAADNFDGSNTTCCNGTVPSSPHYLALSDDGRDAALLYGQKILSENQLSDDQALLLEEDDTGLTYVGDQFVVVLYIEDEHIFEVLVTKNDNEMSS